MSDPDFVNVRRPADGPFGVLPEDLVSDAPAGYDLSVVRSLASEGLISPLVVRPLPGGRFKVVDGLKRLAAIRLLVRTNKTVYDSVRGCMRPAGRVFALLGCRLPTAQARGKSDGRTSEPLGLSMESEPDPVAKCCPPGVPPVRTG